LAEIEYLAPVRDVLSNQYRSGSEVGERNPHSDRYIEDLRPMVPFCHPTFFGAQARLAEGSAGNQDSRLREELALTGEGIPRKGSSSTWRCDLERITASGPTDFLRPRRDVRERPSSTLLCHSAMLKADGRASRQRDVAPIIRVAPPRDTLPRRALHRVGIPPISWRVRACLCRSLPLTNCF